MLWHPGKTAKKALAEIYFLPRLFSVFIVPVVLFIRLLNFRAETSLLDTIVYRKTGAGLIALPRGTGGEEPPAS